MVKHYFFPVKRENHQRYSIGWNYLLGSPSMKRLGVLGHGHIAHAVLEHVRQSPGVAVSFVRNRTPGAGPGEVVVHPLPPTSDELQQTDLVVEAAHPRVVAELGEQVLRHSDLLVTSSAALVDAVLLDRLTRTATNSGTRLILPRGALVGLDAIVAQRVDWEEATITMTKAPTHLDPAPTDVRTTTVVHDGPVAALAHRYPRNVNAMVTFALATLGLENTRCRLVCDPATLNGRLEMDLIGRSGATLHIAKEQPMVGVSGSEMPASIIASLESMPANLPSGLSFV